MSTHNLRVGGVPEHYNLPIHLAIERGEFLKKGIQVQWNDFSEGTGRMTKALREDEVDVCFILTEGIVFDIINGNPSKIVSEYVVTPLTWGIHTGNRNVLKSGDHIFDKRHAISRFGSGSHLMSIVHANSQGYEMKGEQFVEVGELEKALESLDQLSSDVFYWEKYTTKPFVDNGRVRRIGEYVTPWPCFMIAASNQILLDQPEVVKSFLKIVHESCNAFMANSGIISTIAKRYQLGLSDVERWYHSTEWASNSWVSDKMLASVVYHLKVAGIVSEDASIPELIWKR